MVMLKYQVASRIDLTQKTDLYYPTDKNKYED